MNIESGRIVLWRPYCPSGALDRVTDSVCNLPGAVRDDRSPPDKSAKPGWPIHIISLFSDLNVWLALSVSSHFSSVGNAGLSFRGPWMIGYPTVPDGKCLPGF